MTAFILSNADLSIKDVVGFESHTFTDDIEFSDKSAIRVIRKPNIENKDFVLCKDGNEAKFVGICESFSSGDGADYEIILRQRECFFDQQIFVGSEALIASTGIEDFIVSEINANWKNSGDAMIDKAYLTATALTHTRINAKAGTICSVKDGVYNFKTFLGNAKEYYHVRCEFVFSHNAQTHQTALAVNVSADSSAAAPLDVMTSEISGFSEVYSVDVLSKLKVKWLNTTTEAMTNKTYYLKTDRTITETGTDPDRAAGVCSAIYVEAASQDEMYEKVVQEFSKNSYEHKISLQLMKNSRAYPHSQYYVGRLARIKTKTGIKETMVTKTSESNESGFITLTFGKLKVTMIEKIRSK